MSGNNDLINNFRILFKVSNKLTLCYHLHGRSKLGFQVPLFCSCTRTSYPRSMFYPMQAHLNYPWPYHRDSKICDTQMCYLGYEWMKGPTFKARPGNQINVYFTFVVASSDKPIIYLYRIIDSRAVWTHGMRLLQVALPEPNERVPI